MPIRNRSFAGTTLLGSATALAALPVAERYWIDQPLSEIGALVGLYSSMKSCLYDAAADVEPPPPYTSEMTRLVPATLAWTGAATTASGVATRPRRALATKPRRREACVDTERKPFEERQPGPD